jgi:hypothetical protein
VGGGHLKWHRTLQTSAYEVCIFVFKHCSIEISIGVVCVDTGVAFGFLCFVVCSSSSSVSTKYDPDLLKSDVALARNRVSRLKRELEQIRAEMSCTQRGVDTLAS